MSKQSDAKTQGPPDVIVMATWRVPLFLTIMVTANFLFLFDSGRVGPIGIMIFALFGAVMTAAWYRILTRPILKVVQGMVAVAPKPLWPVQLIDLPSDGRWSYADAFLVLPTSDGGSWEGFVRLRPNDEAELDKALAARGLVRSEPDS